MQRNFQLKIKMGINITKIENLWIIWTLPAESMILPSKDQQGKTVVKVYCKFPMVKFRFEQESSACA